MLTGLAKRKKTPKKLIIAFLLLLLLSVGIYYCWRYFVNPQVWHEIGGERQLTALLKFSSYQRGDFFRHPLAIALMLPFLIPLAILNFIFNPFLQWHYDYSVDMSPTGGMMEVRALSKAEPAPGKMEFDDARKSGISKDYATTNLQVAEVDEADIIKTDGDYIYSLSGDQVIITDVRQPQAPKIISRLNLSDGGIVEDLLLAGKLLIIIGTNPRSQLGVIVNIYDLSEREHPQLVRQFSFKQRYFTSRIADNKLYLLAKDYLSDKQVGEHLVYSDNHQQLKIADDELYYLPHYLTDNLSIIATLNLATLDNPLQARAYLLDLEEVYVSRNHLYLVVQDDDRNIFSWQRFCQAGKTLFSWRGVWALLDSDYDDNNSSFTTVYKFSLANDLAFVGKLHTSGTSLNQFSFDEDSEGNFRLALNDVVKNKPVTKVEIYNKQLKLLGSLNNLAPGERMYAARFIGNRAYLVTYQTIDPLFVLDLSSPSNPKVLGELKIPGYSTYLHPYDEQHLLGFGIETKEHISRDEQGKIISTRATRESLKIALFDVSEVSEPKQLATTTIGDSLTSSAILTNHKALLFSREKNLLAIPVNYYRDQSKSGNAVLNESYWVYRLSLSDGFALRGKIIHETNQDCYPSHLLRGLYIRDYLYTLSESTLKVNYLSNLQELATLKFAPAKQCVPDIHPVLID